MDGVKPYLLPGVAALVLLGYYAYTSLSDAPPASDEASPASTAAASDRAGSAATPASPAPDDAPGAEPPPAPAADEAPSPAPEAAPARDRARRDALQQRLVQAQRQRLGRGEQEPVEEEALGQLDEEYIQARVKDDLLPLATECYENALEDDEEIEGRMVMSFDIVGEPDVGGIVDDVVLDPTTEIEHADMIECMRESMMSMTFDPPQDGGTLRVTYPFVFEPSDAP